MPFRDQSSCPRLTHKPTMITEPAVTQLLKEIQSGDKTALDQMLPLVYGELKKLASYQLRRERSNHTLQPTALVHEAYMRLINQREVNWRDRAHFFGLASQMMRRILVNHALAHKAEKRGGSEVMLSIDEVVNFSSQPGVDIANLDDALNRLERLDPQQSRIVEMRFFGGLTVEEVAEVLNISSTTVKREWRVAKAWLYEQIVNNVKLST